MNNIKEKKIKKVSEQKIEQPKVIKVKILSGKDKGKIDTVEKVLINKKMIFLKTYNKKLRYIMNNGKKTSQWFASPIHVSNLKYINE